MLTASFICRYTGVRPVKHWLLHLTLILWSVGLHVRVAHTSLWSVVPFTVAPSMFRVISGNCKTEDLICLCFKISDLPSLFQFAFYSWSNSRCASRRSQWCIRGALREHRERYSESASVLRAERYRRARIPSLASPMLNLTSALQSHYYPSCALDFSILTIRGPP